MKRIPATILFALLVFGILPSCTALSVSFAHAFPELARYSGPFNPLKLGAPLLFVYLAHQLWTKRFIPSRYLWIVIGAWLIGTLATLASAIHCGFPSPFLREWAAISLGLAWAIALRTLPSLWQKRVILGWVVLVGGTVILDRFFPEAQEFILQNVFDPDTRKHDLLEAGPNVVATVFGRQSSAKLLTWLPWIAFAGGWIHRPFPLRPTRMLYAAVILALSLSAALALATSQRGPFLAQIFALAAFLAHRAWRERKPRILMTGLSAALVAGALVLAVVPPEIRKTRLGSLTALLRNDPASKAPLFSHEQTAQDNARVRVRIFSASMEVIRNQPLGNACLPESWYSEHGLMPGHSHNLVVEQYRSRGWLWGTLHLAIWITAGIFAWRRPDLIGSALIGGWVSIFVGGMFDHPWFVLNHSLVLWTFLLMALGTPAGINRLPVDLPPSKAS